MKKYFIFFNLLVFISLKGYAQTNENIFTSVPVVNGKVVFQQFIHTEQGLSDDQKYAILNKWGKDNYTGSPTLQGIRFDEKAKSVTVSAKTDLSLDANSSNVGKMVMTYRFDATVSNAGCMLVIRDISYQPVKNANSTGFVKPIPAEDTITDSAVNTSSDSKELNSALRKSTLAFFNGLYGKLSGAFE